MTYPLTLGFPILSVPPSFYPGHLSLTPLTLGFYNSMNLQAKLQEQCLQNMLLLQKSCLQQQLIQIPLNLPSNIQSPPFCNYYGLKNESPQSLQNTMTGLGVDSTQSQSHRLPTEHLKCEFSEENFTPKEETHEEEPRKALQRHIRNILCFIIEEHGTARADDIEKERQKYAFSPTLLALFDSLAERYQKAAKCREDMIRYVLRKALGYLRDQLKNEHQLTMKAASIVLCKKYFKAKFDDMMQNNIDIDNQDEMLNFLLPYKKNSRNRTANNSFISEIFASEVFYQDYLNYLENFDEILEEDNQKKVAKFTEFLTTCVEENTFNKIKSFKRLPWLKIWLKTSKVIAHELLSVSSLKGFNKNQSKLLIKKQKQN